MKRGMIITKSQLVLFAPSKTVSEVGKIGGDDGGDTERSQPVLAYTGVSSIRRGSADMQVSKYRNEEPHTAERMEHRSRMISGYRSCDVDLSVPLPAFTFSTNHDMNAGWR